MLNHKQLLQEVLRWRAMHADPWAVRAHRRDRITGVPQGPNSERPMAHEIERTRGAPTPGPCGPPTCMPMQEMSKGNWHGRGPPKPFSIQTHLWVKPAGPTPPRDLLRPGLIWFDLIWSHPNHSPQVFLSTSHFFREEQRFDQIQISSPCNLEPELYYYSFYYR